MVDIQDIMKSQVKANLQAQFDDAVMVGDKEAALKISEQIRQLENAIAPAATQKFGAAEVKKEIKLIAPGIEKHPEKLRLANEYAKVLSIDDFESAAEYASALVEAVNEKFGAPAKQKKDDDEEAEDDEEEAEDDEEEKKPAKKARKAADPAPEVDKRPAGRNAEWKDRRDLPPDLRARLNKNLAALGSNYTDEQRKSYVKRFVQSANAHRSKK